MKDHPSNKILHHDNLDTAPQDEPYVPFGVAEISHWTMDDIRKLPRLDTASDPPGWEWFRTIIVIDSGRNNRLEEALKEITRYCLRPDVVGLSTTTTALGHDCVLVYLAAKNG